MSSINSVRKLQILYFSEKKKKIKNLKNGGKKGPDIGIYTYYCIYMYVCMSHTYMRNLPREENEVCCIL